jgi:alcohol dehydrogenase, propanol-preferring
VGKVVKLGPNVTGRKVGDRVGIKWVSAVCGSCDPCLSGMDGLCRNGKISGYYTPGTFQQYVLGPADYVTAIPDNLPDEQAAPMLCAGVTTYTAIKRSRCEAGQWLAICGAGGGLGHIAVQLAARGFGYRVIGIDVGSKKELVMSCGAEQFVDATAFEGDKIGEEVKRLTGGQGAKGAIVVHADNDAYASAIDMLSFGGTLVCVGIPDGTPVPIKTVVPARMVFQMLTVTSTAVGNRREAKEVLEMAARGIVKTKVEVRKMDQLKQTFEDMNNRKLQGRVVLDLA